MRRLVSISAILALIFSVGSPALVSAYVARNAAMACHRPALHETGAAMTHEHCRDMADMDGMDASMMPPQQNNNDDSDGAAISSAAAKCPMECCTLAGSASQAAPASPLVLAAHVVIERGLPVAKVVFSRNGFSSHTDRGPPVA